LAQSGARAPLIRTQVCAHKCPRKCRPYICLHKWHERRQSAPADAPRAPSDARATQISAKMMLHFMLTPQSTESFFLAVDCRAAEVVGPLLLRGSLLFFPRPLLKPTKATMMTRTGTDHMHARPRPHTDHASQVGKPVKSSSARALGGHRSFARSLAQVEVKWGLMLLVIFHLGSNDVGFFVHFSRFFTAKAREHVFLRVRERKIKQSNQFFVGIPPSCSYSPCHTFSTT